MLWPFPVSHMAHIYVATWHIYEVNKTEHGAKNVWKKIKRYYVTMWLCISNYRIANPSCLSLKWRIWMDLKFWSGPIPILGDTDNKKSLVPTEKMALAMGYKYSTVSICIILHLLSSRNCGSWACQLSVDLHPNNRRGLLRLDDASRQTHHLCVDTHSPYWPIHPPWLIQGQLID